MSGTSYQVRKSLTNDIQGVLERGPHWNGNKAISSSVARPDDAARFSTKTRLVIS